MALTIAEARAAAQSLRAWPAGKRAYALAWSPDGKGYFQAASLARAIRSRQLDLRQLGPAATVAVLRLSGEYTAEALGKAITAAVFDMRFALTLSPREWILALDAPLDLAERLETWAGDTQSFLRGQRLDPANVDPPSMLALTRPGPDAVNLSATARQVLRAMVADPDAWLYYDRRTKSWFLTSEKTGTHFKVREQTADWMVREQVVEPEVPEEGQKPAETGLRYVPSDLGRRSLVAEEGAGVQLMG